MVPERARGGREVPKHTRRDLLSLGQLRERGWTPTTIRHLLGEHDDTRPNPVVSSAAPMRLWLRTRVEAAEANPVFVERRDAARRQSQTALAAAQRRREELLTHVESIRITVHPLSLDKARRRAVRSYNDFHAERAWERGDWFEPLRMEDLDRSFLDRITVNYVRHERTDYDSTWQTLVGKVGRDAAHTLLRERALHAVAERYPELAGECEAQIERHRAPSPTRGGTSRRRA